MGIIENLESMLARGQDNALLRYSLGGEHLKLQHYEQAIEHLRKALAHNAKYSAAWKLLGEALAAAGKKEDAMKVYEDGIRVAQDMGDIQAAKEMTVFLKRLHKTS